MSSNRLKRKAKKAQFSLFGATRQLEQVSIVQLVVDGTPISKCCWCVIVDRQLTFKNHVDGVVRGCFYQLRQLRSIRQAVPGSSGCHAHSRACIHHQSNCCTIRHLFYRHSTGGASHQQPTENTWRAFSCAACTAVCVLNNYLIWLNLLKQPMTNCSSAPLRTITFCLIFYLRNLTIVITCTRNIIAQNSYTENIHFFDCNFIVPLHYKDCY